MKKNISVRLALLALAILIVLPVYSSVKHLSSNRSVVLSRCRSKRLASSGAAPPQVSIVSTSAARLFPLHCLHPAAGIFSRLFCEWFSSARSQFRRV